MRGSEHDHQFEALLNFMKHDRGFDFTGYKRSSLMRRMNKRMVEIGLQDYTDYRDYLEVHPDEFVHLFNTILINVTSFFRDPEAWEYLRQEVIPKVVEAAVGYENIRVWSVGCSSGQEAYSLAIALAEYMGSEAYRRRVKIYATDVDEEALRQARQATYSLREMEGLPEDLRDKYFEQSGSTLTFRQDLRRAIIFGNNDVLQHAPISRLDLLVCRNTLMYFNAEAQSRILTRFHFALKDTGYLFLGRAEMLLTHANLFSPANLKHRIFSKVPHVDMRDRSLVLDRVASQNEGHGEGQYAILKNRFFDAAIDPAIAVDAQGHLALANEQARLKFKLEPRDLGRPFQDLELSYHPVELRSLLQRAYTERHTILVQEQAWVKPSGETRFLDIRVLPLLETSGSALGAVITLRDVTDCYHLQHDLNRERHERETVQEELQSAIEELETANEEMQSTVEELQTTNEELQATNEEMDTVNEELQSTNEAERIANDELRARTHELLALNNFLQSILDSVNVALVVVDKDLVILDWNVKAADLWGLRAEEAVGKSLLALDIGLPVDQLQEPVQKYFKGEDGNPDVTLDAVNRRGRSIRVAVTCTMRLGPEGERQGAVLMIEELGKSASN
ncbi:MAG: PAS domain-containing protein [Candidatus Zixiibacteriota bacterium]|nr:MAG: PAS domain-containing protein [candidate division Zixibacteria bacterium]